MPTRLLALALLGGLAACGGGTAPLGFGLPSVGSASYSYSDTTSVGVAMGDQQMAIRMTGRARYGADFGRSGDGLRVSLTVHDLDARAEIPMAGVETADESDVDGDLVFVLDRQGNATITSTPRVSVTASRVISRLGTAHTFFPRLPDRVVETGDSWVDTISYDGQAESGPMSETSVVEYTVVGETTVDGRALLEISLSGTTDLSASMDLGGMEVTQSAQLSMTGRLLWDRSTGMMFEMVRRSSGEGTARVPVAPFPLPIDVEVTQRVRLAS